jgi:hypothetical protein
MTFYIDAWRSRKVDKECVAAVGGCDLGHTNAFFTGGGAKERKKVRRFAGPFCYWCI